MLKLALSFFAVSLIAWLCGFIGISAALAGIGKILFLIAIAVFLALLALALIGGSLALEPLRRSKTISGPHR